MFQYSLYEVNCETVYLTPKKDFPHAGVPYRDHNSVLSTPVLRWHCPNTARLLNKSYQGQSCGSESSQVVQSRLFEQHFMVYGLVMRLWKAL